MKKRHDFSKTGSVSEVSSNRRQMAEGVWRSIEGSSEWNEYV